jgi:hypothetical protein
MAFEIKLKPEYDRRKSFYGKAKVFVEGNDKTLISYSVKVAEIKDGKPIVYGLYSNTTTRHIKDFLKQNGFKAETSKQIMQDYGVKKMNYKVKQKKKWINTGGYRGYDQSAYAVAGSSYTGNLEDSPCPSYKVHSELKDFQEYLNQKGIKSKIKNTQSSNAFMMKRWVVVEPEKFGEAQRLAKEYIKSNKEKTQFIHDAD